MAFTTIHRIGNSPNAAPSVAARPVWATGMGYTSVAITSATASATSEEIQAVSRTTPSRTNSTSSGSAANRALKAREWATGSSTWRYI
jgi:hypothetical protein